MGNCRAIESPGRSFSYRVRSGFTLIELLVIIAIISLLAAILFPVFGRARENARRISCLSNLKQIGIGMLQYLQDYDEVYPMHFNGPERWPQMMHPYVKSMQVYQCPSRPGFTYTGNYATAGQIAYGMNYWLNSYYYPSMAEKGIKVATVQRTSETVWIAEINGVPLGSDPALVNEYQCYPSYFGRIYNPASTTYGFDAAPEAKGRLATRHFEGVNVVWADGHAKWTKREILENDIGATTTESAAKLGSKYWWGR